MNSLRKYGRLTKAAHGFLYDFWRYFSYAPWNDRFSNKDVRGYDTVKIYHALEKSLSFPNRKSSSGWENAKMLLRNLQIAYRSNQVGCHEKYGIEVLSKFASNPENYNEPQAEKIRESLLELPEINETGAGILKYTAQDLHRGRMKDPESFFMSRYTLREFDNLPVDDVTVRRAVSLAMKAPSACNRQPWGVYHTADPQLKSEALRFQFGNKGFGHLAPNLLVCTIDQFAFKPGNERYQHWIDGGILAMSIIHALHALGLGACCLNWSQHPHADRRFRNHFDMPDNEAIILMIAFGHPKHEMNVCASKRRPIEEVLKPLRIRST
ncbi:nitroreductase family protein [Pseudorhodobacter sp. W20_MBD10_FR17]|uniref:nitroreductase family protein n=1 Tax=Pseudorhodobacter sp. W20_MBD10_FR17 TaxID=3240266 RepID=UPI003F9534E1